MILKKLVLTAAAASLMVPAPAMAAWKLVEAGETHDVAKSDLTVTPTQNWNRNTKRPINESEVWTINGITLNEVYFVGGIQPGDTLYKNVDKKRNPLPEMGSNMLLTDIPDFYESSLRTAFGTSLFEIESVEPTQFAGQPGVKFQFNFGTQGDALVRRGMAAGTIIDGKLYMISYIAPSVHYYDAHLPEVEALIASTAMAK